MLHNIVNGAWSLGRSNNMEISQAILTVSIVMLSVLLGMLIFVKPKRKAAPLPPGPRGLPIVGYLPFLSNCTMLQMFTELSSKYGPLYKLRVGRTLWVIVNSASVAQEVTRDQDIVFANHVSSIAQEIFSAGCNDIPFSPYGSEWRHMRKIFAVEFVSKSNVDATYDLRKNEIRNFIKLVSSKVGTPIDIVELLVLTLTNVIINMLLGYTIEDDEKSQVYAEIRTLMRKCLDLISRINVSDFFPEIARFDLQGIAKDMKAGIQSIDRIIDAAIHKGMKIRASAKEGNECKEGNTKKDFIRILLELGEQEETGSPISRTQFMKRLAMEFGFVSDTVCDAAKGLFTELLNSNQVIEKVQRELDDVVGVNNIVEESHMPKLKYLNAVVREGLRLHPPLPYLLPRFPSESCTLAGYTVPKDSRIYVNLMAIQRDPQHWDNPSEFKPERFLNEPDKWDLRGNNFQYLPFGSGRRTCPGINVAMKMLMFPVASLLHSFDWQAVKTKSLLAIPTKRLPNPDLYN